MMIKITYIFLLLTLLSSTAAISKTFDILIRNARILDGTNPWYRGDIGIKKEQISALGHLSNATAKIVVDANHYYVSPGFIDTHSHTSEALASQDRSQVPGLLTQGVTTVLLNPDGAGPIDPEVQSKQLLQYGLGVNAGLLVPHGSLRHSVMGMQNRAATQQELQRMQQQVQRSMSWGSFGISSGTFYAPGSFASNVELIDLASVVANYNGVYTSHIRDESNYTIGLTAAVEEVIAVAKAANIRAVITHIKALGPPVWGLSKQITQRIQTARDQGISVYTDQYPYIASSTSLAAALVPRWAFSGGREAMQQRFVTDSARIQQDMQASLQRRGGAQAIQISYHENNPNYVGKTLKIIANELALTPVATAIELISTGNTGIISFNMQQEDVLRFMTTPWNMTTSDGGYPVWGKGSPHPRAFGSFPRKLRLYVKEKNALSLSDAIRSMTSLPAQVYQIKDRGVIREGAYADLVIFDLDQLTDKATFDAPYQLAKGIETVIINGKLVLHKGRVKENVLAGKLLRKTSKNTNSNYKQ